MEFIQVLFEVPDWVVNGVRGGEYKIFGGVIRNTKGQIVFHLKNGIWEAAKEGANNAANNIKKSYGKAKIAAIVLGGVAIVTAIGYATYKILTNKNTLKKLNAFDERLKKYINDGIKGTLSVDRIVELKDSCDDVIMILDKIEINDINSTDFENQKFNDLINSIRKYTEDLSKANKLEIIIPDRIDGGTIKDNIIDIRKYMELQKEICILE